MFVVSIIVIMKFNVIFFGFIGFFGLVLVVVLIKNDGILVDIVVFEKYIVKYKVDVDVGRKKKYEFDIINKVKKKNKKGVVEFINIDGFLGYVVEIFDLEFKELRDFDLVSGF